VLVHLIVTKQTT